jgi:hypothetical protein
MAENPKLSHLEAIRDDVRDEVKRRIQQRDQYSMQLTVALGAIAVGAFSASGTPRLFILAPLVAIYFTALILYSYRIHDSLASYLRTEIEPLFEDLTGLSKTVEWETWYQASGRVPGVRRWFFVAEMWTVTVVSLAFLLHREWSTPGWFQITLRGATIAYSALSFLIPYLLRKRTA